MSRDPQSFSPSALAVAVSAALVVTTAVLVPWGAPGGLVSKAADINDYFSPAQIARSESFHDAIKWPAWLLLAVQLLVAALLVFTRLGRRLTALAQRGTSRWWLQVVTLVTLVSVATSLVTVPLGAWAHVVAVDYGLSSQSWPGWLLDRLKSVGLSVTFMSLGLLVLVWLARRFTHTWFFPAAAAAAAAGIVMSFAYPVVVEPVFNTFTPLADGPLRSSLMELAERDGVKVSDVLVSDASRRTTALNAYVSGFGSSKRIVVYDTLVDSASQRETELIVAHELGHAKADDVVVGTAVGALGAALGVLVLFLVLQPDRLRRPGGATSVGDPAIVPVVLALSVFASILSAPAINAVSRQLEARADLHALNLTSDPRTFIDVQRRLAITNLTHLQPNQVLAFWFSSHPGSLERLGMAEAWRDEHADKSPPHG
ncbi:MAG: M48 family metallopeptidase [Nocardioidaceae bacterium]